MSEADAHVQAEAVEPNTVVAFGHRYDLTSISRESLEAITSDLKDATMGVLEKAVEIGEQYPVGPLLKEVKIWRPSCWAS